MKKLLILVLGIFLLVPGVSWAQTQVPSERIEDDFEATTITVSDTASADTIVVSDSFTIQRSDSQFVITSVEWTSDIIIGEGSAGTYLEIDGQTSDPGASDRLASKQYVDDNAGSSDNSLPKISNLGDTATVSDVTDVLGNRFSNDGFLDVQFDTTTISSPSGNSFNGAIYTPTGDLVLIPHTGDTVGMLNPSTNEYRTGATHGETGSPYFIGAAVTEDGRVVMAPYGSDNVGLFDPEDESYSSGPAHSQGDNAFVGACMDTNQRIIFAPTDSNNVGIFDPSDDSYSDGPADGQPDSGFRGCTLIPDGRIILTPSDASNVGIFDPSDDSYSDGPAHGQGSSAFAGGGCVVPDGRVIFAPRDATEVGIFDPSDDSYSDGPTHGEGADAFRSCTLMPDGRVLFASFNGNLGIFDPSDDSYSSVSTSIELRGASMVPDGRLLMVDDDELKQVTTWTQTKKPFSTTLYPLLNKF